MQFFYFLFNSSHYSDTHNYHNSFHSFNSLNTHYFHISHYFLNIHNSLDSQYFPNYFYKIRYAILMIQRTSILLLQLSPIYNPCMKITNSFDKSLSIYIIHAIMTSSNILCRSKNILCSIACAKNS